ncbi:multiple epidermal growth factor-like domains protein 9 isoform X2 [Watersipora subatra]|uniref:multiple epidermal growth factor-like domains protein 9 isoform X2 n=1 Tax=Watersipora subatra TaxID=2589382 RepID=UPI00355BAED6
MRYTAIMALIKLTHIYIALLSLLATECLTENRCPSPDDQSDAAGAYSLNVSWSTPVFNFTDTQICHFYLNISYGPSQKGSHHRTTHMNCDSTMLAASITDLTPDTNVTIQLRTCLLLPPQSVQQGFICTEPVTLKQQTAANPDKCPLGSYTNINNTCAPCQCNNKTRLCQTRTGTCLDCMDGSDGKYCEKCVNGYVLVDDRCEPAPPLGGPLSILSATSAPAVEDRIQSHTIPTLRIASGQPVTTVVSPLVTSASTSHATPVMKSAPVVIVVTSILVVIAIISCIIILLYKRFGGCRKKPVPFWTIQLQSENQPTIAYSDMLGSQFQQADRNRLIDNDFTARLTQQKVLSDENPYQPVTA